MTIYNLQSMHQDGIHPHAGCEFKNCKCKWYIVNSKIVNATMIREVKFESQDRRIKQILACLNAHGIASIEEANEICEAAGLDPYKTCEETQMICFENAKWAYVVGTAIAL